MQQKKLGIVKQFRRGWYRIKGEQELLVTFWPNDYRRGATYGVNGQEYEITRYVRTADPRYFEVWGSAKGPRRWLDMRRIASLDFPNM